MDLSDIIYIICLALGIFAPIFQQREKKKSLEKEQRKQQSHPADEEYMPSPQDVFADNDEDEYYDELPEEQPQVITSLDDIFRALREGRQLMQPSVAKKPLAEEEPLEVVEKKEVKSIDDMPQEGVSVTTVDAIMQNEISDNDIYATDSGEFVFDKETVDWRQAVVANEILNRKY